LETILDLFLRAILPIIPMVVAGLSARRGLMSNSVNGLLYAGVFLFSATAFAGVTSGMAPDRPVAVGAIVMALLSGPAWLLVRELSRRPEDPHDGPPIVAVFRSIRARTRAGFDADDHGLQGATPPR
jgi:hypothetical protein